ncbi:hypothetical protein FWK35_00002224 [Aphis craccivora]|uniref:Uncharacterized protein n=1 Tax=Aphis craccivora TaxID=307492 RepID=A0A6G0ZRV2_APHCR|nr:hypothetical protein FWK35_00002224 [Aphis craccivora]
MYNNYYIKNKICKNNFFMFQSVKSLGTIFLLKLETINIIYLLYIYLYIFTCYSHCFARISIIILL